MTDKCFFFFIFSFLLTAEKFVMHEGQKDDIRRMLDTQLAVVSWAGRKRNASSGLFLFCEKIEGGFCIYLFAK